MSVLLFPLSHLSSMEPGVRHNNIYWRQLNLWPFALFEISRQSQHSWQGRSYSPTSFWDWRWKQRETAEKTSATQHERQETVSRGNKRHGTRSGEPHRSHINMHGFHTHFLTGVKCLKNQPHFIAQRMIFHSSGDLGELCVSCFGINLASVSPKVA